MVFPGKHLSASKVGIHTAPHGNAHDDIAFIFQLTTHSLQLIHRSPASLLAETASSPNRIQSDSLNRKRFSPGRSSWDNTLQTIWNSSNLLGNSNWSKPCLACIPSRFIADRYSKDELTVSQQGGAHEI
jgi:hypothetical protein